MRFRRMRLGAFVVGGAVTLAGCFHGKDAAQLHYLGDADLNYYKGVATQLEYPDVAEEIPDEVTASTAPRTLHDRHKDEVWNMSMAEALQLALSNNRIIRLNGSFMSPGNGLLSNPNQGTSSVYDPAIQETGVLFGTRGVEAALADFDTTFATSMLWGRNEQIQNTAFTTSGAVFPGQTLTQETAVFNAALSKRFAYGASLQFEQVWNYLGVNSTTPLFPSSYAGYLQASYRQPLWAGAGTEFTRIAGPINDQFTGITGVSQGVVIARINNDIALSDFEYSVHGLLRDVESVYWDLHLSYRLYHTAVVAHNSALRTWREAKAKLDVGGVSNFKPVDEAQARDQLYQTRAAAESALNDIYNNETRLRRLIGLAPNDGRIIRPADELLTAQFVPEWYGSLAEGLTRRVELRKQKWTIKSLELQLQAAHSLTNPRLDFVSAYRVNGFGDDLFGNQDNDGVTAQGLGSAYETLTQGNQTGWNLGFEFSVPIGFRQAHTQVHNYELRVAKAREALAVQELEVAHELATAFQAVAVQYQTAQSNFNRRIAAERRVELFEAEFQVGTSTLDLVLRAQASLAEAERAYYTSLVNYNKALSDLQYRKGTILEYNNVTLAEGDWSPEAYKDALRRAWARSHAFDSNHLLTAPEEFVAPGVVPTGASAEASSQQSNDPAVPPSPSQQPVPGKPAAHMGKEQADAGRVLLDAE